MQACSPIVFRSSGVMNGEGASSTTSTLLAVSTIDGGEKVNGLLVTPLDGALSLPQIQRIAVAVGKHLPESR